MQNTLNYENLQPEQKAIVAIAVLLDGQAASDYLRCDTFSNPLLSVVAKELLQIPSEIRIPLLGTLLREVIT